MTIKVTKNEEFDVYNVQGQYEHGTFFINEKSGVFVANTTFGMFAYSWSSYGTDFKQFLGNLNFDYAVKKWRGLDCFKFNPEKAVDSLKSAISEALESGHCDEEEAKDAILEAADLGEYTDKRLFMYVLGESDTILDVIGHNDWHLVPRGSEYDPICVAFWNELFIPFMDSYHPEHNLERQEVTE